MSFVVETPVSWKSHLHLLYIDGVSKVIHKWVLIIQEANLLPEVSKKILYEHKSYHSNQVVATQYRYFDV